MFNQLVTSNRILRKACTWWKTIFLDFVDIVVEMLLLDFVDIAVVDLSLFNCDRVNHFLATEKDLLPKLTHAEFRKQVTFELAKD